jgi:hypothetical protein
MQAISIWRHIQKVYLHLSMEVSHGLAWVETPLARADAMLWFSTTATNY